MDIGNTVEKKIKNYIGDFLFDFIEDKIKISVSEEVFLFIDDLTWQTINRCISEEHYLTTNKMVKYHI